jgi:hypothetical protein
VIDRLVHVDEMQESQEGQGVEGAVEEPGVFFSPLVASERAGLAILETGNIWTQGTVSIKKPCFCKSTAPGDAHFPTCALPFPRVSSSSKASIVARICTALTVESM